MRKLLYIALTIATVALVASCSKLKKGSSSGADFEVEHRHGHDNFRLQYLPFKDSAQSRKWGLIGLDGEVLLNDTLENEPSQVVSGIFAVKEGGYYHYYTAKQSPERIGGDYVEAGLFYEDVAPCVERGKGYIEYIDKSGNVVFDLKEIDGHRVEWVTRFWNGLARVKAGGKIGFINTKGEVVIAPRFLSATPFSDGASLVVEDEGDNARNYLSHGDYKITTVGLDGGPLGASFSSKDKIGKLGFQNGLIAHTFKTDSDSIASEFVNLSGQVILPATTQYKEVTDMYGTRFGFNTGTAWGVADNQLTMLIEPKLDGVLWIDDDVIAVKAYGRYKLIDYGGQNISKIYDNMFCVDAGKHFLVKDEKGYTIIDERGMEVTTPRERINLGHLPDTITAGQWRDTGRKMPPPPVTTAAQQPKKPEAKTPPPAQPKQTAAAPRPDNRQQAKPQPSSNRQTQTKRTTNNRQPQPKKMRARDDTIIHL